MNDTQILEQLRAARALLDKSYVKWTRNDGRGGHCAYGVLDLCTGVECRENVAFQMAEVILTRNAIALHPELVGACAPRGDELAWVEHFDMWPLAYVNNQTDKATTLAVFDAAILELEIKLASPSEAAETVAEVAVR